MLIFVALDQYKAGIFVLYNHGFDELRVKLEAFPRGIPEALYPWGCTHRIPNADVSTVRFRPRPGMEEITRRWKELACPSRRLCSTSETKQHPGCPSLIRRKPGSGGSGYLLTSTAKTRTLLADC